MKCIKTHIVFVLLFGAALSSCKKDDPEPAPSTPSTPVTTPPLSIDSPYQATFKVDGTTVHYANTSADFEMVNSADNSLNPIGGGTSYFKYGSSIGNGSGPYIGFMKGTATEPGGGLCSDAEFLSLFTTGTADYSIDAGSGVYITYFDDDANLFKSDFGSADQTGSNFKIEARKELTGGSSYTLKLYITFNCKVYNTVGAGTRTITDGVLIINVAKI